MSGVEKLQKSKKENENNHKKNKIIHKVEIISSYSYPWLVY